MTLRIAVFGCMLAAAGLADVPVTMHNDPMTLGNGGDPAPPTSSAQVARASVQRSIVAIFGTKTYIPHINVHSLLASPKQKFGTTYFPTDENQTLLVHGHYGGAVPQPIVVLQPQPQPQGHSTILEMVKKIDFYDNDKLHVSLYPTPGDPTPEITFVKGSIDGAGKDIPVHEHEQDEYNSCLKAVTAPQCVPARASDSAPRRGMRATHVIWASTAKTVAWGTQIVLDAAVTSAGAKVPAAKATLLDNRANPVTGAVQKGGKTHFVVTPSVPGDHCFTVAYPVTGNYSASKSAEVCIRVLPSGCPVMKEKDLLAQEALAADAANTVWGIVGDKMWDVTQEANGVVKYSDHSSRMTAVWLDSAPRDRTPVNENCGVVHFCHMKEIVDVHGNWTQQPDCAKVTFQCAGKTYTWTPPPSLSQPAITSGHSVH